VLPSALVEQLATPGRMFIPVGTYVQQILQVDKAANGDVTQKALMGVVVSSVDSRGLKHVTDWSPRQYVPLTDRENQI
jgi:protein-L-isoaspartate O-methyltransferase